MKLVTMTNLLAKRFGIEKALEMIKTAGFDGYDCSIFEDVWDSIWNEKNWLAYTKNIAKKATVLWGSLHSCSSLLIEFANIFFCIATSFSNHKKHLVNLALERVFSN